MSHLERLRTEDRPDAVRGIELSDEQRGPGEHLRAVHDMYRAELARLVAVTEQVEAGVADLVDIRAAIHDLALRRDLRQYGTLCAHVCRAVTAHHTIEDRHLFPAMRGAGEGYAAVVDQLAHEHEVIHELLEVLDAAVVATLDGSGTLSTVVAHVRDLDEVLRSHFRYEEEQLTEPLGIVGLPV